MKNRDFIIVVTILSLSAFISLTSYLPEKFESFHQVSMADFPKKINGWLASDMPLGESDYKALGTRNVIMRNYKNRKRDSVILYLVYSEKNRQVTDPPEISYLGSGTTIVKKSVEEIIPTVDATKMIVEKSDTRQMVVYWFKVGDLYTKRYLKQQLKIVIGHMLRRKTPSAMIRLSTDIKNNDEKTAFKTLQAFTSQIKPLLQKYVP